MHLRRYSSMNIVHHREVGTAESERAVLQQHCDKQLLLDAVAVICTANTEPLQIRILTA